MFVQLAVEDYDRLDVLQCAMLDLEMGSGNEASLRHLLCEVRVCRKFNEVPSLELVQQAELAMETLAAIRGCLFHIWLNIRNPQHSPSERKRPEPEVALRELKAIAATSNALAQPTHRV
jgi:hypothetical protein